MSKTVRMRAPNGEEMNVPAEHVEHYKRLKAVVVKSSGEPVRVSMDTKGRVSVSGNPTKTIADLLPAAGGFVGGMVGGGTGTVGTLPVGGIGGPGGAVVGAGIGGAGGEAVKQLIYRSLGLSAPETPGEAFTNILGKGAFEGATEGVGQGIGAAARRLAPALMRSALNPLKVTSKTAQAADAAKAVRGIESAKEVPWEEALAKRTPVTKRGLEKAEKMKLESMAQQRGALMAHPPGGMPTYTFDDVLAEGRKYLSDMTGKGALTEADDAAVWETLRELENAKRARDPYNGILGKQVPLTLDDLNVFKSKLQDRAKALYKARRASATGAQAIPRATVEESVNAGMAKGARSFIQKESQGRLGIDMNAINEETRRSKALFDAINEAISSRNVPADIQRPGTWPMFRSTAIPSNTALAFTHPAFLQMVRMGLYGLPASLEATNSSTNEYP